MKHSRLSVKIVGAICALLAAGALFASCASTPSELPYDITDREIIQIAQNEYDAGHTDNALYYYETLLVRFGSDPATYVEGRFEIAHIYFKQKKYELAAPIYMEILDIYSSYLPGTLPESFRKLAQKDLAKIPASKLTPSK